MEKINYLKIMSAINDNLQGRCFNGDCTWSRHHDVMVVD